MVLEVRGRCDQARGFVAAEHHRQLLRHMYVAHPLDQFAAIERDVEEELQAGDGGVERDRRDAPVDQVQLEASQILGSGRVGGALKEAREVTHCSNVRRLRLGAELARAHVVEQALAQRRNSRCGRDHDRAPVEERGRLPRFPT
ncbi:hypothetical protein D3C85_1329140 [compost metagenome]